MAVKHELLKLLEKSKGIYLSGERIAESLGVSRAAVWKAINALKTEGYAINAVTNKGYMLSAESNMLSEEGIRLHLKRDIPLTVYHETDSTNRRCISLALEGAGNGTAVVANRQTAGRGRRGRSFYSPSGTGIYLSVLIHPQFDISKSVLVTVAASVAVARAIERVCGISPQIKWVNDIYINGKKVCGILTEAVTDFESGRISSVVAGIGINCSTTDFPEEIRDTAGCIPGFFSRNELTAAVIDEFLDITEDIESRDFIGYYREHSMIIGNEINIFASGKDPVPALATGIDDNGGLEIRYSDGTCATLTTGEVSIRIRE